MFNMWNCSSFKTTITPSMKLYASLHRFFPFFILFIIFLGGASACSSDEPYVRTPEDIIGVWTNGDGRYMFLDTNTRAYNLYVTEQDGEIIGEWKQDGYFYEPGYNLVIYIDERNIMDVFQIISMTDSELVWCWVKEIKASDIIDGKEGVGEIIGDIIKEAQEGFKIDPSLYQYFHKISMDEFYDIIDSTDLNYPWDF